MEDRLHTSTEFASLLADIQSYLFAYLMSLIGDTDLAEDLRQETNRTLLAKSDEFELGTSFHAWAFAIARIEVLRARDRHARRREVIFDQAMIDQLGATVERHVEDTAVELRALQSCLEKLDERARTVVNARYFQNDPVHIIAQRMGLNPNTASKILHRARVSLMNCIREQRIAMDGAQ